ncbi:hypothetical protein ST201phi2-1p370 [Pseudomonas phage 201phi2-1]|uniref:Uncharacterized protein n=1 Tax=Pseudomonas phage 201phi2-1 TaxID=198110 RepID=B3FJN0_BP201|nr:hypothetical protein ST201phi2-1p370 [Pseudomonas phage 201phi2-1]ABY63195.1 hypothetical protein 201phi2-1p370 [Pseudomonas phage 201phi2-1]
MASLEDDVVSHIAWNLYGIRNTLINDELHKLTPVQLVDAAISRTTAAIQDSFELKAKGACESNGDPHYCVDISTYYWGIVNDPNVVMHES